MRIKQRLIATLMVAFGGVFGCSPDGDFESTWWLTQKVRLFDNQTNEFLSTQVNITAEPLAATHYVIATKQDYSSREDIANPTETSGQQDVDFPYWLEQDSAILLTRQFEKTHIINFWQVRFRSAEHAAQSLNEWQEQENLVHAEPDWQSTPKVEASFNDDSFGALALTYQNDLKTAYWLRQIRLADAFSLMQQTPRPMVNRPVIAVLDSGVDIEHPSLVGQVFTQDNPSPFCEDDYYGCDTSHDRTHPTGSVWPIGTSGFSQICDPNWGGICEHGTHVAGLIAATPQVDQGYGGICPDCLVLPIKVVSESGVQAGTIMDSSIIKALSYLMDLKRSGVNIRVVNTSFGKFRRSRTVSLLIEKLSSMGNGVLFVAAAGNENTSKPQYPAALDDVIAVANIDSISEARHPTSNYGYWVDLSAPGSGRCGHYRNGGILSSVPGGIVQCAVGTSFAAPIVSGVAGLLASQSPDLSAKDLKSLLLNTASEKLYESGPNEAYYGLLGRGDLDAEKAMEFLVAGKIGGKSTSKAPQVKNIKAGCGVISAGDSQGKVEVSWLLLLALPLLLGIGNLARILRRHVLFVALGLSLVCFLGFELTSYADEVEVSGATPLGGSNTWTYDYLAGYIAQNKSAEHPESSYGTTESDSENLHVLNFAVGLIRELSLFEGETLFGYRFGLDLKSGEDDIDRFIGTPSRRYFPFPMSQANRTHRLNLNQKWHAYGSFEVGLSGYFEAVRLGNQVIKFTDEETIRDRTSVENIYFEPEVSYLYGAAQSLKTSFSTVFYKSYSYDSDEFTFQTYSGLQDISWTFSQLWNLPEQKTQLVAKVFQIVNQFKYSDKDYVRQGGQVRADYLGEDLNLYARFVSFRDIYSQKVIRQGDCSYGGIDALESTACPRRDEGQAYQIGVGYHATDEQGLLVVLDHREIKNHNFPEFNKSQTNVLFEIHKILAPEKSRMQNKHRFGPVLLSPLTDTAI